MIRQFFGSALFGLLFSTSVYAQDVIRIGAVYPTTGPVAADGQTLLQGARTAIKQVNAAGGIGGKLLELVVEDGACIPAQSVAAAEKLISSAKVVALIGAFCSSSTGAVMDVAKRNKVPMVAGISTQAAGGKKFAFLVVNDDWGRSIIESYGAALSAGGVTVVDKQIYDTNDNDMFSYITNIKRAAPDAIVLAGNTQNAVTLTEQIRQLGLKGQFFGEGSFTAKNYYELVGQKSDGFYGLMAYVYSIENPTNKAFVDRYKADYNDLPTTYAASGFHEALVVASALKRAGSLDPVAIRDAIAQTELDGLAGPIKFSKNGQGYGFNVFLTLSKNASPTIAATAPIEEPR
jgi:branched-chain amino acid transport system substrate-binding protein